MKSLYFLNLIGFSQTGGLEKFNRCFMKALDELSSELNYSSNAASLYDTVANGQYYPVKKYKGFSKSIVKFVPSTIITGLSKDVIILGHINLAVIGWIIKTLAPSKKLMLICHGIEVWQPVTGIKKKMLQKADRVLAVSDYTKQQIVEKQGLPADKVSVFHNTIDPYFDYPKHFGKDKELMARYGIADTDYVVYTLCRLSSKEQYKGYDAVVKAIGQLKSKYPQIKYLLAGKYDEVEKARLDKLIAEYELQSNVIFAGYIKDEEVTKHYQLGDVFIMPSKGEGFGIVFIEAMACGRNVVAGNADGSKDALRKGELGVILDADNVDAIATSITEKIEYKEKYDAVYAANLQQKVIAYFGFAAYKQKLKEILNTILN